MLERLAGTPGGPELLALAERHEGLELVGGAVRDMLLGIAPRELDAVVPGEVGPLAAELAELLGGQLTSHERFATAVVRAEGVAIDLASMRAETYPAPGALPEVRPGTPAEDLARRDFTVNALAVALAGPRRGRLRAAPDALDDLAAGRLRVLHDEGFRDDPTRILRLARYAARLRFEVEPRTAALAEQALAADALSTVSGGRLGAELRLALGEADPLGGLGWMQRLGVFEAWRPGVRFDEQLARTALAILPYDGSVAILLAATLALSLGQDGTRGFLAELELPAGEGERAFVVARACAVALERVERADTTEGLLELVDGMPVEALALAAAIREGQQGPGSPQRAAIERWLTDQRHVALEITGEDLLAAGVPQGAELGRRLRYAYRLLLDGQIQAGREPELRAALEERS